MNDLEKDQEKDFWAQILKNQTKGLEIFNQSESFKEKFNLFEKSVKTVLEKKKKELSDLNEINNNTNNNSEFENLLNEYKGKIYKKIREMLNLNNNILDSIQLYYKILNLTFNIEDWIEKINPNEDLIYDNLIEIINSSLFLKVKFSSKNLSHILNGNEFPENIKKIILNLNVDQHLSYTFDLSKQNQLNEYEKDLEETKRSNLEKLIFINSKSNLSATFGNDGKKYANLTKLKLVNFKINNFKFDDFPVLINLTFKHCLLINLNYFSPKNLKRLSLINANLINIDFHVIFQKIIKEESLRENIEYLSFAKNNLTSIDLCKYVNQNNPIPNIKKMDFHDNKIFSFNYNPEYFPKLKYLNFCNNNFASPLLDTIDKKKLIYQTNGNLYLIDNDYNRQYFERLKYQLENFIFDWDCLNLSGMINIDKNEFLEIPINKGVQFSIKKLNLSYCNLKSLDVIKFLDCHHDLVNLKTLNLDGNFIDLEFFKAFNDKKLYEIFGKLKHFYINGNEIGDDNFYYLKLFIEKNIYLKKFFITKNPFCKKYTIKKSEEEQNGKEGEKECSEWDLIDLIKFIAKFNIENPRKVKFKFDTHSKINLMVSDDKKIEKLIKKEQ